MKNPLLKQNLMIKNNIDNLKKLLKSGVIGFYNQVEITTIFANLPDKSVVNILTIIVSENRHNEKIHPFKLMNKDRIIIRNMKKWSFGIKQYRSLTKDILNNLKTLEKENKWVTSGDSLFFEDDLLYQSPIFIPSDSNKKIPLNNILKNNFWNGSYVAEWKNTSKIKLDIFFKNVNLLQELSEKITNYIPISLASISDRLGNIIFQIPIDIIKCKTENESKNTNNKNIKFNIAFHQDAKPRDLRMNFEMKNDGNIYEYRSYDIKAKRDREICIPRNYNYGEYKIIIWDIENNFILYEVSGNLLTICVSSEIIENKPRILDVTDDNIKENIKLIHIQNVSTIESLQSGEEVWTNKRIYKDEKLRLLKQRNFVQYKPIAGEIEKEHNKAISDIRWLIRKYGKQGVWLWDPYLDAENILKTLFHCPYFNSDLRALTNLDTYIENKNYCRGDIKPKGKQNQLREQREIFKELNPGNFYGIKLQFRARINHRGWNFHDRFIIFPETLQRGVLAWSLGTSVNSVGKKHHILQQVDDGQLISDSFLELWNSLDKPENSIWPKPLSID